MSTGTCMRCGRSSEIEYGADGMSYCSACIFYGMNRQCFRCRMYLPATELQQYKGQWVCPYCLQDMRDEDRRMTERVREKPPLEALAYVETCERCGRDLSHVYIWNGRRLCKKCLEHEQDEWELMKGKPFNAGQRVSLVPMREAKKMSMLDAMISNALALIGFKRKKKVPEIVVHGGKMPIEAAKPMTEKAMAPKPVREDKKPEAEGLMAIKRKKREKAGEKKEEKKKQ